MDILMLIGTVALAAWATWPPRGDERGWLLLAGGTLWAGIVGTGLLRGVQPGFLPWLFVLGGVGALVGLLVVWSATNLLGRRGERGE